MDYSYTIRPLRCFSVLSLYASFIRSTTAGRRRRSHGCGARRRWRQCRTKLSATKIPSGTVRIAAKSIEA